MVGTAQDGAVSYEGRRPGCRACADICGGCAKTAGGWTAWKSSEERAASAPRIAPKWRATAEMVLAQIPGEAVIGTFKAVSGAGNQAAR